MTEKKMVARNFAVFLGIICVTLAADLIWGVANYTSILNGKDSEIAIKNSQITGLNAEYHDAVQQQQALVQQVDGLEQVHLWEINFKWDFTEPSSSQHYLHFYGTFFNSGNTTATDVRADVWISNAGVSVAYCRVDFGAVGAKNYINFDETLNYNGHADNYTYMVI